MQLTLEVVSSNGAALGPNRRKTVGPEGARIGRAKENDWVILDQYISRVNARIHYMNGTFYIEGLGRNPLAMYEANNTVANDQLLPLRDGDRFFLDQYEISATILTGQAVVKGLVDDPFGGEPPVVVPNARPADVGFGGVVIGDGGSSGSANLDPLAILGGVGSKPMPPPRHIELNQVEVLDSAFDPPMPMPKPGTSANGIPDDWFTDPPASARPQTPAPLPPRRPKGPPVVIPDTWDRSGFTQLEQQQRPVDPPKAVFAPDDSTVVEQIAGGAHNPVHTPHVEPQTPPTRPRPMVPPRVAPDDSTQPHFKQPHPAQPLSPQAHSPLSHAPLVHSGPPHAPQPPSAQLPSAEAQSSLGQLLCAAGLPSAQMTPEIAAEIGEALRIVVEGVMDVLHSRAEIKSELRMAMTRIQPQENNPLKFSPNVEAALHTLLVERNRGYLPTTRAFEEAFADICNHQVAVLQGIRVAFESLLGQFSPEHIEAQMEAQGRRGGLLNIGTKARFRDYYGELFEQLTRDPDASFRRLFGEPFAQAYEAQMEHLALQASRSKRRE